MYWLHYCQCWHWHKCPNIITLAMLNKLRCHAHFLFSVNQMLPRPLLIFSQSDYLTQTVYINLHTQWQTVQIQISWLNQIIWPGCWYKFTYSMTNSADSEKPTDLDLYCLQWQDISGSSRTRVKWSLRLKFFNPCPASSKANWSGSALFVIKYLNL